MIRTASSYRAPPTTRRRWIKAGAAAAAACFLPAVEAASVASRIIDAHTHFYDPTRPQGVPWPPWDSKALYRKVMPEEWKALARPHGIRETVVVEASPWLEDNQWVLDLSAGDKGIVAFCGNLDPNDPRFPAHLKRFAANQTFRGVRWRSDLVRIDENPDAVRAAAALLADYGLQLDWNGPPALLPHLAKLAADVPDLRIVIDHGGGCGDPRNPVPGWKEALRLAASRDNVFVKVSGLVEQAPGPEGRAPRDTGYYLPVLDHLWECFGEDRLVYGSNWPVSDRGAPYDVVLKIVSDYFRDKGPAAAEKYFWRNALSAYRLKDRPSTLHKERPQSWTLV